MMNKILDESKLYLPEVFEATIDDIQSIIDVIDLTWLETYPVETIYNGQPLIVTKEDIINNQINIIPSLKAGDFTPMS